MEHLVRSYDTTKLGAKKEQKNPYSIRVKKSFAFFSTNKTPIQNIFDKYIP